MICETNSSGVPLGTTGLGLGVGVPAAAAHCKLRALALGLIPVFAHPFSSLLESLGCFLMNRMHPVRRELRSGVAGCLVGWPVRARVVTIVRIERT
jgi:hypothetical protein